MNRDDLDELLTVQDLAQLFAVSVRTIWRWLADGRLPAPVKLGSSTVRWRASDIKRFMEQLKP